MTHPADTARLIGRLAAEAGRGPGRSRAAPGWCLLGAALASLALAVLIILAWFGIRRDLMDHAAPFAFKLAAMLALAAGGLAVASRLVRPGRRMGWAWAALLPGLAIAAARGATDRSGLSPLGVAGDSVAGCVGAILAVSVPGLLLTLAAIRTGAPTRPRLAGAVAGLVAGALGGAAYALACRNDAGLFLTIWYPAAAALMAAAGALLGRRALAW